MQEHKYEILEKKLNPDEIIEDAVYIPNLKTILYDFLDRFLIWRFTTVAIFYKKV